MLHEGTVTVGIFIEFLKRMLVGAQDPIFPIADGHPTHRAKKVKTFVDGAQGKLRLFSCRPMRPN